MKRIRLDTSNGVLQGLVKTVNDICEVLPSLEVRGDNASVFINRNANGTVIRSKNLTCSSSTIINSTPSSDPWQSNALYTYVSNGNVILNKGDVYIGDFLISLPSYTIPLSQFEFAPDLFIRVYVNGSTINAEVVNGTMGVVLNQLEYRLCKVTFENGQPSFARHYTGGDLRITDKWGI